MNNQSPSPQEWAALYQASVEFKQIAAWDWMYDADLFGVQNPANGEIGYCCVMGNLGEHFALGVYLGTDGLETYLKIQSGAFEQAAISALFSQKCLMASYEDRDYLEQQDRAQIKDLGLKFRGRNVWPLFRSYLPSYHPWFVSSDEAQFLTIALQQAIDVALRLKDTPDLLTPPRKGRYLVRVFDGAQWGDQWLAPAPIPQAVVTIPQPNELRVQRIKQTITARQGVWEADFFRAPTPVQEHKSERPFYPYMSLWVDQKSGFIMHTAMFDEHEYRSEFQDELLALLEQSRFLPKELHVMQPEVHALLAPIATRLGIKLKQARALPMLDEARNGVFNYFQSGM